jgi:hypothetical protein
MFIQTTSSFKGVVTLFTADVTIKEKRAHINCSDMTFAFAGGCGCQKFELFSPILNIAALKLFHKSSTPQISALGQRSVYSQQATAHIYICGAQHPTEKMQKRRAKRGLCLFCHLQFPQRKDSLDLTGATYAPSSIYLPISRCNQKPQPRALVLHLYIVTCSFHICADTHTLPPHFPLP